MNKQPSVQDLIGKVSQSSDLRVLHSRNRYLQTITVGPSTFIQMTVPRMSPNALLDCRGIRMRFQLAITSGDANCCVDSNVAYPFSRVRILSGSSCLLDINKPNLLMSAQYNAEQNITISDYQKSLTGDGLLAQRRVWATASKEYLIPLW